MALPPRTPAATSVTGSEMIFGIQGGKWKSFTASLLSTLSPNADAIQAQVNGMLSAFQPNWGSVTNKPSTLSGYGITDAAAKSHTHAVADVNGLQAALDGKQPTLKSPVFSGVTNSSGVATISFNGLNAMSFVQVIDDWSGQQLITGKVLSSSATGCTVQVMRSRATLLLSAGPFEPAPAGVTISVRAVGS